MYRARLRLEAVNGKPFPRPIFPALECGFILAAVEDVASGAVRLASASSASSVIAAWMSLKPPPICSLAFVLSRRV